MNSHKNFVRIMKTLATIAFMILHYFFIPFGAITGAFAGLIFYGIWSPFFEMKSDLTEKEFIEQTQRIVEFQKSKK
jgi:hypothetical protein